MAIKATIGGKEALIHGNIEIDGKKVRTAQPGTLGQLISEHPADPLNLAIEPSTPPIVVRDASAKVGFVYQESVTVPPPILIEDSLANHE